MDTWTHGHMDTWKQMDAWTDACMDTWRDTWTHLQMDACKMDAWTHGHMNKWINEHMDASKTHSII